MALNNSKHGALAASLIPFSLLVGATALYVHFYKTLAPDKEPIFLAVCVASPVLWIWGFFHLVRHYKLSPLWTVLGFAFIPGLVLLVWAGANQPRWEQQRIRRYAAKQSAEFPPPNADKSSNSGKKAKVPPPR